MPHHIFCDILLSFYRMMHQVVPTLSIQGRYGFNIGPEPRVWEQPDVSPCMLYQVATSTFHCCDIGLLLSSELRGD